MNNNAESIKYELDVLIANSMFESAMDKYYISNAKTAYATYICEYVAPSEGAAIMEGALDSLWDKFKAFIDKIIEAIGTAFNSIKEKFTRNSDEKKKLKLISKSDTKGNDVEIYSSADRLQELNLYIQEMAKLERELVNIKVTYNKTKSAGILSKDYGYVVDDQEFQRQCERIEDKMNQLDEKYNKNVINAPQNKYIIKKALNEAASICDKDLDNIELDLKKIKANSEKILTVFKTDAKGLKSPVQYNIFQKISNKIAEKTRKAALETCTWKKKILQK